MAATVPDDSRRSASIANLLLPTAELPERNLLSLSRLAAEMEPVSPADAAAAAAAFNRTRSVPSIGDRRNQRSSLGVANGNSGKRLSRTKSAFGPGLRRAVAAAAASTVATTTTSSANSDHRRGNSQGRSFDMQNHSVLRPIHPQASSKATSTTNSLDSHPGKSAAMLSLPRMHPARLTLDNKRDIFQVAAARLNAEYNDQPRTPVTPRTMNVSMMDVDLDHREPSSSSHDGRLQPAANRSAQKARTTPDAKRAQNRESAKRFRVAQKKRWADLQDLVKEKDEEIQRLTDMLQKVTETRLPSKARPAAAGSQALVQNAAPVALDKLVMAELDLFVKLVSSPGQASSGTHSSARRSAALLPSPASNIGSLHRVLVASTDGSITGVRHLSQSGGIVARGRVGQYVWDDVHESDNLQLRFTVLHASRMAADMAREALVFAYRRRVERCKEEVDVDRNCPMQKAEDADKKEYVRMKGCVHPVLTDSGEISHLMLAEFVET